MHCNQSELLAYDIKTSNQGLGSANLQKLYNFACSTPPLSPPAMCMSRPTNVITTTVKYLHQLLKERQLGDPVPSSWKSKEPSIRDATERGQLVELRKERVHFFDGDSAEINVREDDEKLIDRLSLSREHQKIRVRARNHDAPETAVSVRFYKQSDELGNVMTPVLLHNLGLESLRYVRACLFSAQHLFAIVPPQGLTLDTYGRYLIDFVFQEADGSIVRLSEMTARNGYTMAFFYENCGESKVEAVS